MVAHPKTCAHIALITVALSLLLPAPATWVAAATMGPLDEDTAAPLVAFWTYSPKEDTDTGAQFGAAVAFAGDLDGNGHADALVGAPLAAYAGSRQGLVYLFCASQASAPLPDLPNTIFSGGQQGSSFGAAVGSAGDVDGNGYDDLVIGAERWNPGDLSQAGAAFVYYGRERFCADPPAVADRIFEGEQANALFGRSVAAAGDVNGDGYDDLIIGAPGYRRGSAQVGAVYIFFGSPDGLRTDDVQILAGDQAGALFGNAVSSAGDVNGDGYDDIIIGAPSHSQSLELEGAAFVYLGAATGITTTDRWVAYGGQARAYFGSAVSNAGDVGADAKAYAAVAVGAPGFDGDTESGGEDWGRVSVFHGSESGLPTLPNWTYTEAVKNARLGFALSVGDIDDDGYADLIVGAPSYDDSGSTGGTDANESVLIFLGTSTGLRSQPTWQLRANQGRCDFGWSVAGGGDVNADGLSDLLVGAPRHKRGERTYGQAFAYLGAPPVMLSHHVFLPLVIRSGP